MASKYFHDLLNQVPDDLPDSHTTAKPATFAGEKVTVAVVRKALGSGSQPHRHPNVEQFLPIRLSPTPTICSVSPWTAGKGRRRRIEEAIRLILDCSENRTGV